MNKLRDWSVARRIFDALLLLLLLLFVCRNHNYSLLLTTAFNQREQKVAIRRQRGEESCILLNWVDTSMVYWNRQAAIGTDGKRRRRRRRKMMMNKSFVSWWCMCICVRWPVLTMHWQKRREKKKKSLTHSPISVASVRMAEHRHL
jgi:hypothetical protein